MWKQFAGGPFAFNMTLHLDINERVGLGGTWLEYTVTSTWQNMCGMIQSKALQVGSSRPTSVLDLTNVLMGEY